MGGGNSKNSKAEVIKPKSESMQQAGSSQFAAPVVKGPTSKPNFGEPSPAMSVGSKASGLQRNESQEMDAQTPNQQAKQVKMQVAQSNVPPPAAFMQQAPSPAPENKKAESQADRQEMLQKQKRDMDAKRQRQLEEEKMRKLQLINEQQKAKKAAESAAQAAEAAKQKQMKQQQQQETFAQHNDTGGRQESQSNSEINSPPKRGKRKNDDNIDLSVNGAGLNRAESKPAMAVAPVAQVQFKVVQYNPDKQQNIGGNPWASDSNPYSEPQSTIDNATPIHFGVMNQNNSKNDSEADRNINMSDLNELLGI